jgi:hypothetical protein
MPNEHANLPFDLAYPDEGLNLERAPARFWSDDDELNRQIYLEWYFTKYLKEKEHGKRS